MYSHPNPHRAYDPTCLLAGQVLQVKERDQDWRLCRGLWHHVGTHLGMVCGYTVPNGTAKAARSGVLNVQEGGVSGKSAMVVNGVKW